LTPSTRYVRRPDGSNWGDFGDDDEIGRLNLITPDRVLAGVAEVREGLRFCLSLPLDLPGGDHGTRAAPRLFATGPSDSPNMNKGFDQRYPGVSDVMCDDAVTMALQYSTQWDGLCHTGQRFDADGDGEAEIVYYNGWRAHDDIRPHGEGGALRLGIDKLAASAIQTRGVMIDLERHFGPARRATSYDDLMRAIERDGATIEPGDILCLHTGYARALVEMAGKPVGARLRELAAELDGADRRLLQWITDSGIAGIAADTPAIETFRRPADGACGHALLPLHEHCLFKLGLPLGELWWLSPLAAALAARGRTAFLLTAPPLRLPGAAGSPVTPVATI
jgi:kynurenine formamidase